MLRLDHSSRWEHNAVFAEVGVAGDDAITWAPVGTSTFDLNRLTEAGQEWLNDLPMEWRPQFAGLGEVMGSLATLVELGPAPPWPNPLYREGVTPPKWLAAIAESSGGA